MLDIRREPGCWTLVLDRPQAANALSAELVEGLIAAIVEAEAAQVPVLALRGSGRHFCAGFDFSGIEAQSEADLLQRFVRIEMLLQAVQRSPCLTVAFAHGRSFGAGVDLFAACRWRVADEAATFRMPGLAFGIVLGTRRFAKLVGTDNAREILESLRTFGAQEAQAMGFMRRIVPQDGWAAVQDQAGTVAATLPPPSRRLLADALEDRALDEDLARLTRSAATPGLKERIRAYLTSQERQRSPR